MRQCENTFVFIDLTKSIGSDLGGGGGAVPPPNSAYAHSRSNYTRVTDRYVFYSRVARNLVGSAKNTAVMTVMTSTPRSASHYRGNAVIITALSVFIFI